MSLEDFNPDDSSNVSNQEQEVRSKSPVHEAVHNMFQDLSEAEDESFSVVDGEVYCDYDEMVDHIVFMVGAAANRD